MVFLSATLPNSLEFAEWVASVHGSPCHVVNTDYRPTPLVHYAFPLGGNGLYLLVDDKGNFKPENFNKMMATFPKSAKPEPQETPRSSSKAGQGKKGAGGGGGGGGDKEVQGPSVGDELDKLIRLLKDKKMDPIIVFSFSRRYDAFLNSEKYDEKTFRMLNFFS